MPCEVVHATGGPSRWRMGWPWRGGSSWARMGQPSASQWRRRVARPSRQREAATVAAKARGLSWPHVGRVAPPGGDVG